MVGTPFYLFTLLLFYLSKCLSHLLTLSLSHLSLSFWFPTRYKRPSFSLRKATFCVVKDGLLERILPPSA